MMERRLRGVALGLVGTLLVGIAACAPLGSGGSPSTTSVGGPAPVVSMPVIPLPPASSFAVSLATIEESGCDECAAGGTPDPARFFYGSLPLGAVDRLAAGTSSDVRADLGSMFASGYFGGVYLRGALSGGVAEEASPFAPVLEQLGALTQSGLDGIVGDLRRVATTGTEQQVRDAASLWSVVLAAIAGYNRGYLEVALANPPEGVTVDPSTFTCASLFDCRSSQLPLPVLDQLAGQLAALNAPPTLPWLSASGVVNTVGNGTVPAGRQVWDGLLAGASFDPAAYRTIVDLSVGFLEVTQAAMLASLAGPTGGDLAMARRGLDATAGLITWAGSYFLGLASPLANSALPTLTCANA